MEPVTMRLPYKRETKGTVIYAVPQMGSQPIGQVYVQKDALTQKNGQWPGEIELTLTVPA